MRRLARFIKSCIRLRSWTCANPGATAEQYEAAMRAIARRYGV